MHKSVIIKIIRTGWPRRRARMNGGKNAKRSEWINGADQRRRWLGRIACSAGLWFLMICRQSNSSTWLYIILDWILLMQQTFGVSFGDTLNEMLNSSRKCAMMAWLKDGFNENWWPISTLANVSCQRLSSFKEICVAETKSTDKQPTQLWWLEPQCIWQHMLNDKAMMSAAVWITIQQMYF